MTEHIADGEVTDRKYLVSGRKPSGAEVAFFFFATEDEAVNQHDKLKEIRYRNVRIYQVNLEDVTDELT